MGIVFTEKQLTNCIVNNFLFFKQMVSTQDFGFLGFLAKVGCDL
jgi:hypothetical protein